MDLGFSRFIQPPPITPYYAPLDSPCSLESYDICLVPIVLELVKLSCNWRHRLEGPGLQRSFKPPPISPYWIPLDASHSPESNDISLVPIGSELVEISYNLEPGLVGLSWQELPGLQRVFSTSSDHAVLYTIRLAWISWAQRYLSRPNWIKTRRATWQFWTWGSGMTGLGGTARASAGFFNHLQSRRTVRH